MRADSFDFVVVGAGSGGLAAAKEAARLGASVAVVEASRIGGTCVLRGCVPKKLMVKAAQLGSHAALASAYGWRAPAEGERRIDWAQLNTARNRVVNNLELAHTGHLARAGIEVVAARARLHASGAVEAGGRRLQAGAVLWATGSQPRRPSFPGHQLTLTSDGLFALERLPASVVVIGGGYIAVEYAAMLAGFGAEVTLIARRQLLRAFDEDLQDGQRRGMRQLGVEVLEHHSVREVRRDVGGHLAVVAQDDAGPARRARPVAAEAAVICAVGRDPNTADAGLQQAGVGLGAAGQIEVDARHRSARAGLFAVGDVIDRVNLTPVAVRAGRLVARQLFGDGGGSMSYDQVATAVFGTPAIGSVGWSEAEARARIGARTQVFRSRFVPLTDSVAPEAARRRCLAKVVVDAESDRVVGCHLQGEEAPEAIQGFAAALTAGITKAQLDETLAVHPTAAEEAVLMRSPTEPAPRRG